MIVREKERIILSEAQVARGGTIIFFGDSLGLPRGKTDTGLHAHVDHVTHALNSSGLGEWRTVNASIPGATTREIEKVLEKRADEIIDDTGTIIFGVGAHGNKLRELWSEKGKARIESLAGNPIQLAALPALGNFARLMVDEGIDHLKILRRIQAINGKRVANGKSPIVGLLSTTAHDYGKVPHIVIEPLNADPNLISDIDLDSIPHARRFASLAAHGLIFQARRVISKHRLLDMPGYPIAIVSTKGVEPYCDDIHPNEHGHVLVGQKMMRSIGIRGRNGVVNLADSYNAT